jgi:hypothetical protein
MQHGGTLVQYTSLLIFHIIEASQDVLGGIMEIIISVFLAAASVATVTVGASLVLLWMKRPRLLRR